MGEAQEILPHSDPNMPFRESCFQPAFRRAASVPEKLRRSKSAKAS